jgi:hypothetical protein
LLNICDQVDAFHFDQVEVEKSLRHTATGSPDEQPHSLTVWNKAFGRIVYHRLGRT